MEHSKSTSQTADQTYQDAVKNLEEARVLWEREMELLCNVSNWSHDPVLSSWCVCSNFKTWKNTELPSYATLCGHSLILALTVLWKLIRLSKWAWLCGVIWLGNQGVWQGHGCILSKVHRVHVNFPVYQQLYENVRKSLEQCDVDADIELFVTTKSTGIERPGEKQ